MPRISFDRGICRNPAEALHREWLETNGLGGFASATISGANTRRYHGLLVAATEPPAVRHVLLSKLEETLIVDGRRFELSTNLYPGATHPEGYRFLTQFRLDPFPIFSFDLGGEAGGVTIEKRVFMVHGENTVVVEYATQNSGCSLELRPLIAFRGYHDLTQANRALNAAADEGEGLVSIQPYSELPRLWFAHNAKSLAREGFWYFNFEYPVERERGLDFHEDLYCPFVFQFDLEPKKPAIAIVSTVAHQAAESAAMKAAEVTRRVPGTRSVNRRGGPVHRGAGQLRHRDCRLPLVHRLGTRHDDLAAGAHARHRQVRRCPRRVARLRRVPRPGHAAEQLYEFHA